MEFLRPIVLAALLVLGGQAFGQAPAREDAAKAPAQDARKPEPQITVRGAKTEEQTKARLRADALLARCIIKPVMTDEEIDLCKKAYRDSH